MLLPTVHVSRARSSTSGACAQGGKGGSAVTGGHAVSSGTALEVMEAVTPVMAATSGVMALCFESLPHVLRTSVYFSSLAHLGITAALIAASAVLAFFMVWVEFALIGSTSALTFMVAGVFKEIVTVLVAHATFGDEFTPMNGFGLAVLISGVCLYNYQKYRKLQRDAEAARAAGGLAGLEAAGSHNGRDDAHGDAADAARLREGKGEGAATQVAREGQARATAEAAEEVLQSGGGSGHALLEQAGKRGFSRLSPGSGDAQGSETRGGTHETPFANTGSGVDGYVSPRSR